MALFVMSITLNAQIGIKTPTPQKTLHVNGSLQVVKDLNVGGDDRTKGNSGNTGEVLMSNGEGNAPVWKTIESENFLKVANTDNSEYAVIACAEKRMFGLQFHPEVTHSLGGHLILKNFVVGICGAPTDWNMHDIAEEFIKEVREVMIVVNICIIFYFLMSIFATF